MRFVVYYHRVLLFLQGNEDLALQLLESYPSNLLVSPSLLYILYMEKPHFCSVFG